VKKIKVLIIDDSIILRTVLCDIFKEDPVIEVVGQASDGEEGLKMARELRPDVITLDYQMPGWNGITTLDKILESATCPVIMLSSHTKQNAVITLNALEKGAVDYIVKPSEQYSWDVRGAKEEILTKIKNAAAVDMENFLSMLHSSVPREPYGASKALPQQLLLIGASTGGPHLLEIILQQLPASFAIPIVIAQHMPGMYTGMFAQRLNDISALDVTEAHHQDILEQGNIYLIPGDYDMTLSVEHTHGASKTIALLSKAEINRAGITPSIDTLMQSAAQELADRAIGVLLTGMGSDGALGMQAIYNAGGFTIAQAEEDCVIFGMPKAAIDLHAASEVVNGTEIVQRLLQFSGNSQS
jgi:two-component system, chemotaxis family, protein-glutamate methylesterase/glutaminase